MAVAQVMDTRINPSNPKQRVVLWSNARVDVYGGPPITDGPAFYDRPDQPVVVAIWIINWTTMAGYLLDKHGGFHLLNGAPAIGEKSTVRDTDTHYVVTGVPYVSSSLWYWDWQWDPDNPGRGICLDVFGNLQPFGGATAPPRVGRRWASPLARKLAVRWRDANGAASMRAYTLGYDGSINPDYAGTVAVTSPHRWNSDMAVDMVVTDWDTGSGYMLDRNGGTWAFGDATGTYSPGYQLGADRARCLEVTSPADPLSFWRVGPGGQETEWTWSTPPTVIAGAGATEVQTVTVSGGPTGGTFTLTFQGATTAAIAYNAASATVQSALEALTTIGAGGVSVTGADGGVWTATFAGALAMTDVEQMTATSSLTGGTTPSVTVATTDAGITASPASTVTGTTRPVLAWSYSDLQSDSQTLVELLVFTETFAAANDMTDPGKHRASAVVDFTTVDPMLRGIASPVDLDNGGKRLYVRAQDSSERWSPWSSRSWTQNVPLPVAPTGLSAVADDDTLSTALRVTADAAGAGDLVRFEFTDDDVAWFPVDGADAVPLASSTTAVDRFPPFGKARTYRAVAYSLDPRVASPPSGTATATVGRRTYALHARDDASLGGHINVQEPVAWTRPVAAGVFEALGSEFPTVVSDGVPKARRSTLQLVSLDAVEWATISGLVEADSVLVYRDPFGDVRYCRVVGSWTQQLMRGATVDHRHTTELPLVEVKPPHLDA